MMFLLALEILRLTIYNQNSSMVEQDSGMEQSKKHIFQSIPLKVITKKTGGQTQHITRNLVFLITKLVILNSQQILLNMVKVVMQESVIIVAMA